MRERMVVHNVRQRESADLMSVRLESGMCREGSEGSEAPEASRQE